MDAFRRGDMETWCRSVYAGQAEYSGEDRLLRPESTFAQMRPDEQRACLEQKISASARDVVLLDVKRVDFRGDRAAEVAMEYAQDGKRKEGKAFLRQIDGRWLVQFAAS